MFDLGRNSNSNNNLPLWRDVTSNNDHNSSSSLPLFYSFLTDNKQCLATSYMSSKGHCCLCQFTAINNDLDVLIKHISYSHPRFTASLKVKLFVESKSSQICFFYYRKIAIDLILNCVLMHSMMDHLIHSICLLNIIHANDVLPVN